VRTLCTLPTLDDILSTPSISPLRTDVLSGRLTKRIFAACPAAYPPVMRSYSPGYYRFGYFLFAGSAEPRSAGRVGLRLSFGAALDQITPPCYLHASVAQRVLVQFRTLARATLSSASLSAERCQRRGAAFYAPSAVPPPRTRRAASRSRLL